MGYPAGLLTHSLTSPHTGRHGQAFGKKTADSLISPGGDGPAVEGSVFTRPAGFWVVGKARRLWRRQGHSSPLQPLLGRILLFDGAAAGPVSAVLDPQTDSVDAHNHCHECSHLLERSGKKQLSPIWVPLPSKPPPSCSMRSQTWYHGLPHPPPYRCFPLSKSSASQQCPHLVHAGVGSLSSSGALTDRQAFWKEAEWSNLEVLVLFSANLFCLFKFISTIP